MIKPELYKRTTDILYQAYFKNTLVHEQCTACAVGNIVAANCRYTYYMDGKSFKWREFKNPLLEGWPTVFVTYTKQTRQTIREVNYAGAAKRQIDSTGYTWQELAKIEYAFETAPKGNNDEDWMFNGLVAVLEVLKDIHQVTDEDLIQGNNKRFKDHYNRKVSQVEG